MLNVFFPPKSLELMQNFLIVSALVVEQVITKEVSVLLYRPFFPFSHGALKVAFTVRFLQHAKIFLNPLNFVQEILRA